jgi:ATP-dependent RNA circularization protein (DNA/RNA ligase family)
MAQHSAPIGFKPKNTETTVKEIESTNDLSAILERLNKLESENLILKKVADKAKLERFTPKDKQLSQVRISLYRKNIEDDYKVVLQWRMLRNDVRLSEKNGIEESQSVEIILDDGQSVQMSYKDFGVNVIEKVWCSVVNTSKDERTGEVFHTVLYNGKEYKLGLAYLN